MCSTQKSLTTFSYTMLKIDAHFSYKHPSTHTWAQNRFRDMCIPENVIFHSIRCTAENWKILNEFLRFRDHSGKYSEMLSKRTNESFACDSNNQTLSSPKIHTYTCIYMTHVYRVYIYFGCSTWLPRSA